VGPILAPFAGTKRIEDGGNDKKLAPGLYCCSRNLVILNVEEMLEPVSPFVTT
jgi:hypothetical protein